MRLLEPFYSADEQLAIELPGARAVFTTRAGGSAALSGNRELLERRLGVRFAYGQQVHGAQVRQTTVPGEAASPAQVDGQATATPGVGAMVLTADCLPIAIAGAGAVAMLHAGWRGLAAGVVEAGVRAVRELGACGALVAAIGPGAGPCCYAVGDEVHTAFATHGPRARRGGNLDLVAVARLELERAGVSLVHDAGLCTICSGLFFSHRRERGITGRQAGIAWLI